MPTGDTAKERSLQRKVSVDQLRQGRAYGPVGILEQDGLHVRCHICGDWYQNLVPHLFQAHACRAREYKIAFGLMQGTALMSEGQIEKRRQAALNNGIGKRGTQALTDFAQSGAPRTLRTTPISDQEAPIRELSHTKIKITKRKRNISQGTRLLVVCSHCGKTFERQRNQTGDKNYCSYSCSAKAGGLGKHPNAWPIGSKHTDETKKKISEAKQGPQITSICPGCGATFTRPAHRESTHCSRACLSKAARERTPHGTVRKYRYGCKCDLCRGANAEQHRLWKLRSVHH